LVKTKSIWVLSLWVAGLGAGSAILGCSKEESPPSQASAADKVTTQRVAADKAAADRAAAEKAAAAKAASDKAAGDKAVAWCRAGKGPFILEMQTYRYRGHSMSDPAKYRTREEVDKVRHDQDPIEQVRNRLLAAKMSEQELKAIDAEVREIVNAAADFAQHDPEPDASELYTDIYR
jgi:pyruvate dehydrogenase E1 component alpha subunit